MIILEVADYTDSQDLRKSCIEFIVNNNSITIDNIRVLNTTFQEICKLIKNKNEENKKHSSSTQICLKCNEKLGLFFNFHKCGFCHNYYCKKCTFIEVGSIPTLGNFLKSTCEDCHQKLVFLNKIQKTVKDEN